MTVAQNLDIVSQGPGIEFNQVSLTLGRTTILDRVHFNVRAGSVHALVG
ncbi:cation ABC transporter ATP-binding protein, partial [Pseudomonas syringae pv. actinidiae ICMP 18804]